MFRNIQDCYNGNSIVELKYWINLIVLTVDITTFHKVFKKLCESIIWKHIRELNITNLIPFENCIKILHDNILHLKKKIIVLLTNIILAESSKVFFNEELFKFTFEIIEVEIFKLESEKFEF